MAYDALNSPPGKESPGSQASRALKLRSPSTQQEIFVTGSNSAHQAIEQQLPASLKSWVTKGSKFPESKEAWKMANKTFLCYIMKHQELRVRGCRDGSALADLAEDQGLIPNTHMAAHNCLQLQFLPLWPSTHMVYRYTCK